MTNKVALIGCGNVGMSYAFALVNQNTHVNELVLIDINETKVEGEVLDLNHSLSYGPSDLVIRKGNYSDCKDADLIVLAAGANRKPGQTRLDLMKNNCEIIKNILDEILHSGFNGIFLIASNPVDIITQYVLKYTKFNSSKVFGSGTVLDTARLRYVLSKRVNINPKNIHAYVVGEHGDSEFIPWSNAVIGLTNINEFLKHKQLVEVENDIRDSAREIIEKKGATEYGIGMCLVEITNAIFENKNEILTVSSYDEENDICISTPTIINRYGIDKKVKFTLSDEELNKMKNSINILKESYNSIDL